VRRHRRGQESVDVKYVEKEEKLIVVTVIVIRR
jgi:hypothetical protein